MNGHFSDLHVRLVDDTANAGQGQWVLTAPLIYTAADGRVFEVPASFTTDFSSVPRVPFAYAVAGNRAHRAATLHDWLVRFKVLPRKDADDLFLEAMMSTGIPLPIANLMHLAVRSYTSSLEPQGPEGQGHNFI